jgi:hypothetical protein
LGACSWDVAGDLAAGHAAAVGFSLPTPHYAAMQVLRENARFACSQKFDVHACTMASMDTSENGWVAEFRRVPFSSAQFRRVSVNILKFPTE